MTPEYKFACGEIVAFKTAGASATSSSVHIVVIHKARSTPCACTCRLPKKHAPTITSIAPNRTSGGSSLALLVPWPCPWEEV